MDHLIPCSGCARHVRAVEPTCPFCGEALPYSLRTRAPVLPATRLGRAATFAFGAAMAASTAAGCGESHQPSDDAGEEILDAGTDAGISALYGGPPPVDSGTVAPAYGAPAPDTGPPDVDAGGGVTPAYGAPAPVDAGPADAGPDRPDAGGVFPAYGVPPSPED